MEEQVKEIIEKCGIHESWEQPIMEWMNTEAQKDREIAGINIQILKKEVQRLDEKLSILLDTYLDQVIDAETYKKKKNEFFNEKLNLEEKIAKLQDNGSSWLEPMKQWLGSALSCAKIARAKNTAPDLAIGIKTVGSNLFLLNRQLSLNYNQGFAELCAPPSAQSKSRTDLEKSHSVIPLVP